MKKDLDAKENKKLFFNIIVPLFNSENYIEKCLTSILNQSYKDFQVQVVDDCSTDSSYEKADLICNRSEKFNIIRNNKRVGALKNIFDSLSRDIKEPSQTIDILIDGDDHLYGDNVLDFLKEKYLKTNCLITYGSHLSSGGVQGKKYPRFVRKFNLFRKYFWYASHLKTFRHDLWQSINPNDLVDQNGKYFLVASDLAIMFPMLEMAGSRQEFIKEVLYVYNDKNPIGDHKIRRKEQILAAKEIRKKEIYKKRNFI